MNNLCLPSNLIRPRPKDKNKLKEPSLVNIIQVSKRN